MLRKSHFQRDLVNGDGVGDMTLANDAATGSAQGEMNLPSLLRLCVADLPSLVFGKDQIQQMVITISNIFEERRRALLLPAFFFFCPVVVLPRLP